MTSKSSKYVVSLDPRGLERDFDRLTALPCWAEIAGGLTRVFVGETAWELGGSYLDMCQDGEGASQSASCPSHCMGGKGDFRMVEVQVEGAALYEGAGTIIAPGRDQGRGQLEWTRGPEITGF